jgi:hypothetical protein
MSLAVASMLALAGCLPGEVDGGARTGEAVGRDMSADQAIIYTDRDFSGTSQSLGPGVYDADKLTIGEDALSSLKVPAGWSVTLFVDSAFHGRTKKFTQDTTYVGDDFNDVTSSLIVNGPPLPEPAALTTGYPITGVTNATDLEFKIASDARIIATLAFFADMLGFAWCGGTQSQYVGQGFDVSKGDGDSFIMQAHYDAADPYASGYQADKRLKITLSNFQFIVDPATFTYSTSQKTPLTPIIVAETNAVNMSNADAQVSVSLTDQHTDTYSHTTNVSFTEGIKVAIKNKAEVPLFGSSEVTTEFSFSSTQGWSDTTTRTDVIGVTQTYSTKVPAMSKKLVEMLAGRAQYDVNYSGHGYVAFNIQYDGFLRWSGNGRSDHPADRPSVTVKFGDDTRSGFDAIVDIYDHSNIPNYSSWDWDWIRAYGGVNLPDAMSLFRSGISAPLSGRFEGVKGISTYFQEGVTTAL